MIAATAGAARIPGCRWHEDKNVEMVIVGLVVVLSVLTWVFYKVIAGLQVNK